MATHESLLPARDPVEADPSPSIRSLEGAGEVFDVLASSTARSLVGHVYEEPSTASGLAGVADTSLQNVQYHLDRLREAGLVEVVDTWYSEKGREMKVYGPATDPLVIVAGGADDVDAHHPVSESTPR